MCELTIKSTSGFSQISIQKKNNTHFDLQNHHTKIETDRETKKTPKETNEAVPKLNSEKSSIFISHAIKSDESKASKMEMKLGEIEWVVVDIWNRKRREGDGGI